jgi:poly-beta-1,6-N-acetyl-D-glucosamine N-deacetylase
MVLFGPSSPLMSRFASLLVFACLALAGTGCLGTEQSARQKPSEPPAQPAWEYKEISIKGAGTDAFVLMYHDVVERRTRDTLWYDSTPEELKRDIDTLKEWGATFVSMNDLVLALTEDRPLPPRAVAFTFDDNYQGFYDYAWPLLKQEQVPVMMYVHTDFIGSQQGRPKMTLETLKELIKDPLFSVGSHTKSHPEDLKKLSVEDQEREITESRKVLEESLGIEIRDISWPVGNYNGVSLELARSAGYRSGVTMESGLAWASSSALEIRRYGPNKIKDAMEQADALESEPVGFTTFQWKDSPIRKEEGRFARVPLALIRGGRPSTVLVAGRESVSDLILNFGAQAGINGGFFQIAAIASSDNRMIGPCQAGNVGSWFPDGDSERLKKLAKRPLVIFTPDRLILAPFRAAYNQQSVVQEFIGDMTDVFVGGAWLVHKGKARTREQIMSAATSDAMDTRRRAFIGVSADGELVLGACLGSFSSAMVAEAAAEAGLVEAVLLDSGFSTSLVFGQEILASGHSTPSRPSRPIPHAILVKGTLEAPEADESTDAGAAASPTSAPE